MLIDMIKTTTRMWQTVFTEMCEHFLEYHSCRHFNSASDVAQRCLFVMCMSVISLNALVHFECGLLAYHLAVCLTCTKDWLLNMIIMTPCFNSVIFSLIRYVCVMMTCLLRM